MTTNSVDQFGVVGVYDPRVAVNSKQQYVATKGGSTVTNYVVTTNTYSNTSIQFTTNPPSENILVDRFVLMKWYITAVVNGDVRASNNGLGLNFGLRQFPINNSIDVGAFTFNNNSVSLNIADALSALLRYDMCKHKQDRIFSLSASMPDQFQNYSDYTNVQYGGSARNPLAAYGEQYFQNRGAIQPTSIAWDGTNTTLQYALTEPLLLFSPWIWDCSDCQHMAFINLTQITANLTLKGNLGNRMFCLSNAAGAPTIGGGGITVSFNRSPELHITYITPPPIMGIPREVSYPFSTYQLYTSSVGIVTPGSSTSYRINNIQLNVIPKRIYIWARMKNAEQNSPTGYLYSDVFGAITSLSLDFNNVSGIFASYSQEDLYKMSLKNGLDMSWMQFSNFTGSVLCVDPVLDIGVSPTEAAGLLKQINLQYTLGFTNTGQNGPDGGNGVNYDIYTAVITDGIFTITNGTVITNIGVLSSGAILNSPNLPTMDYKKVAAEGGNVFGKLKSWIPAIKKALPTIGKVARSIINTAFNNNPSDIARQRLDYASNALSALGSASVGGRVRRLRRRGRGLVDY